MSSCYSQNLKCEFLQVFNCFKINVGLVMSSSVKGGGKTIPEATQNPNQPGHFRVVRCQCELIGMCQNRCGK